MPPETMQSIHDALRDMAIGWKRMDGVSDEVREVVVKHADELLGRLG